MPAVICMNPFFSQGDTSARKVRVGVIVCLHHARKGLCLYSNFHVHCKSQMAPYIVDSPFIKVGLAWAPTVAATTAGGKTGCLEALM